MIKMSDFPISNVQKSVFVPLTFYEKKKREIFTAFQFVLLCQECTFSIEIIKIGGHGNLRQTTLNITSYYCLSHFDDFFYQKYTYLPKKYN